MPVQRNGATFMTVSELAEKLKVHRNTVIYWIDKGQLEASRSGLSPKSPYVISMDEAERVIEKFEELGT